MGKADKELLELAAKALGVQGFSAEDWNGVYFCTPANPDIPRSEPIIYKWLHDDGDALRLAVKLKLIVTFADGGNGPHVCVGARLGPFCNESLPVVHFLDQPAIDLAATRRAIVRAAAEIGKEMA